METIKTSPLPQEFIDPKVIEKTPCYFRYQKENVQNNIIQSLIVDCSSCPKSQCGLHEYACAYHIAQELIENPQFQSLVIDGKSVQVSYHSHQLEKVQHLIKIYKKSKLNPVQEFDTPSCRACYDYLTKLFMTLKILVIADPGMIYKHKEVYKEISTLLCNKCSDSLYEFIMEFESDIQIRDPQWCKDVLSTSLFKIDYYSSLVEKKSTEHTILLDTSNLITLKERNVNGYKISIAANPFELGRTTETKLNELFPIPRESTEFQRRQKFYVINNTLSADMSKIISKLQKFLLNDTDTKRIQRFTIHSNESRKVIRSKVHQSIGSILEELNIKPEDISPEEMNIIENQIVETTVGWGVWEIFLNDDHVNEIAAVANNPVVVETYQDGKCRTNLIPSEEEYNRFIRLLTLNIKTADFYNRVLEAVIDPVKHEIHFGRMRLTLFTSPLVDKKAFIIRKHRKMQLSGAEILLFNTMSPAMLAYCVAIKRRNKANMIYVGDVGSGKSTVQFIIDTKIPIDSTMITVGDIVELDVAEMGFQNITLYADRPGEEKIGQSRSSLIAKTLRMKSDADLITEVLTSEDTAAWVHTWVAGKSGSVTYHAYSIEKMLVRCGDELKFTGTLDPFTKMSIFQTVVASRRILSTDGYKYRTVGIEWVIDEKNPNTNLPLTLPLFKWNSETDTHVFSPDAFKQIYNSPKFRDVLYSVDTVKHHEFPQELELYEILWNALLNSVTIYKELGVFDNIAMGDIPHFRREIKLFTDIYDAQVNMYKKNKKTDWALLAMIGKRRIYTELLQSIDQLIPGRKNDALQLIEKYESIEPKSEFRRDFSVEGLDGT